MMFAGEEHIKYADLICDLIYESALQRGTGIARRSPDYIIDKIRGEKAVVAMYGDRLIGFSYIESWGHGDYVATSGLIVDPEFRKLGLAARIKNKTFELARRRFPFAKIFSIHFAACNETQLPPRLQACDILGVDHRRRILERMRRVCELRYPLPQQPQDVSLLRHALRPEGNTAETVKDYPLRNLDIQQGQKNIPSEIDRFFHTASP